MLFEWSSPAIASAVNDFNLWFDGRRPHHCHFGTSLFLSPVSARDEGGPVVDRTCRRTSDAMFDEAAPPRGSR